MAVKKLSIVTPCFNEEENVRECFTRAKAVIEKKLEGWEYEHIFCDNSSTDATLSVLRELARDNPNVKVIANSRNFGPFNSMFNGMLSTSGDVVIPFLPADCQDPPELIPEMIEKWELGFDVVYGERTARKESAILRWIRSSYYRLVNRMSNISIPLNVGEFTLLDKRVVESLRLVDDYYPYLRGLIANTGFKTTVIKYPWGTRKRGLSKNNTYALIDQALNGLISFTNIPMRLVMIGGLAVSVLSIIYAFFALTIALIHRDSGVQPGIQTLIVGLFFFSGVTLFAIGVLGEYVSAIHSQVRRRPLVIEKERLNFEPK